MATMFRDFSFDPVSPPAYSEYEAERAAMNVSPTSRPIHPRHLPSRPLTPPCTMGDLAVILNQQTLRIDTRANDYSSSPLTPPSDACTSSSPVHQQERPTYSRVAASLLRMQRQASSRMQCCSSHVRDISQLVRMIEEEEQCTINDVISRSSSTSSASSSASSASSSSASSGDDEGIDMDYDRPSRGIEAIVGMPMWRSSERRDTCIRVTRPVRMRKRVKDSSRITKRRSS